MTDATVVQRRRTTTNLGLYSLSQIFNALLAMVLVGFLTRQLGRSGFGEFSYLFVIAALAGLVADFGLGPWLTRSVAEAPGDSRLWLRRALALRVRLTLLVGIPVLALAYLFLGDTERVTGLGWLLGYTTALGFVAILESFLMGHQRVGRVAASVVVGKILELVAVAIVLRTRTAPSVADVAEALALACLIRVALVWSFARSVDHAAAAGRAAPLNFMSLIHGAAPFALAGLALTTYSKIDVLLLERFVRADDLGLYTAGYRVLEALMLIPRSIVGVTFPLAAAAWASRSRDFGIVGGPARLLLTLSLATMTGLLVVAPELMVMLFGPEFGGSTRVVRILALCLPVLFMNQLLSMLLAATHRQGEWLAILVAVLLLNVAANVLLIPRMGIEGAALATLLSESAAMGALLMRLRGKHRVPFSLGWLLRTVAAAAVMGLAVRFVPGGLFVQIPAGGAIFASAALLFRVTTLGEIRALRPAPAARASDPVPEASKPAGVTMCSSVSVVILTHNSEATLAAVLDSVRFSDDLVVVDSGSTDGTLALARGAGATIIEQPLRDWSSQRMAGWRAARHDWVIAIDSDEVVDSDLARGIQAATVTPFSAGSAAGHAVRVRNYFLDRPLLHGGLEADDHVRLAWRPLSQWEGDVHEHLVVRGPVTLLPGFVQHFTGMSLMHRLRKVHDYARLQANNGGDKRVSRGPAGALYRALRFLFGRLIVRSGWRDGWHGLIWWWLIATERLLADFLGSDPSIRDSSGTRPGSLSANEERWPLEKSGSAD